MFKHVANYHDEWLPVYTKEDVYPENLNETFGQLYTYYKEDVKTWLNINKDKIRQSAEIKPPDNKMFKTSLILKNPHKYLGKELTRELFHYSGKLREYSDRLSDHLVKLHDTKKHSIFGPNLSTDEIIRELVRYNQEKDVNSVVIKNPDYPDDVFVSSTNKISSVVNHWFPEIYECIINTPPLIDQVRDKDTFYARIHRIVGQNKFSLLKANYDKPISAWLNTYMKVTNGNQIAYNFPLPLAKWIYTTALTQEKFKDDKILYVADMSMGWGGRLAGLMSALEPSGKIMYQNNEKQDRRVVLMGTDVNKSIEDHYRKFYNFWKRNINTDLALDMYNSTLGAEYILDDPLFAENKGKFHFMFTSPPYFNKEKYSTTDDTQSYLSYPQYDRWVEGFLEPMLKNVYELLRPGGECWVNIADVKKSSKKKIVIDTETGLEYTGKYTKDELKSGKYEITFVRDYYPIQDDTIAAAQKAGFRFVTIYKMIFGIVVGTRKSDKTAITQNAFKTQSYRLENPSSDELTKEEKLYKWEPIFIFIKDK